MQYKQERDSDKWQTLVRCILTILFKTNEPKVGHFNCQLPYSNKFSVFVYAKFTEFLLA